MPSIDTNWRPIQRWQRELARCVDYLHQARHFLSKVELAKLEVYRSYAMINVGDADKSALTSSRAEVSLKGLSTEDSS